MNEVSPAVGAVSIARIVDKVRNFSKLKSFISFYMFILFVLCFLFETKKERGRRYIGN